jgi:two-component system chemotaxis sensor kinase CheA
LTLAIITSLTVSVGGERYVLPQINLAEIVRMRRDEMKEKIDTICGIEVLRLRDQLLPLVRLDQALDIEREKESNSSSVVVLRAGSKQFGLIVDQLHDNEEIVVKPLSGFLKSCNWFAGATILGDGTVAMILDAGGLLEKEGINIDQLEEEMEDHGENRSGGAEAKSQRSLILFSNNDSEQFALPLDEVRRLEKITAQQIERIGHREYIQHRGRSIPLVRLESLLPVQSGGGESEVLFVLIPRSASRTEEEEVGIIATRIIDTVNSDSTPEPGDLRQPGLLGSSILDGCMTLFLDTEELLGAAGF